MRQHLEFIGETFLEHIHGVGVQKECAADRAATPQRHGGAGGDAEFARLGMPGCGGCIFEKTIDDDAVTLAQCAPGGTAPFRHRRIRHDAQIGEITGGRPGVGDGMNFLCAFVEHAYPCQHQSAVELYAEATNVIVELGSVVGARHQAVGLDQEGVEVE